MVQQLDRSAALPQDTAPGHLSGRHSLSGLTISAAVLPQAAGAIHTDFERGFICAEVMAFDVLKDKGTEAEVKAAGKYRQEVLNTLVQQQLHDRIPQSMLQLHHCWRVLKELYTAQGKAYVVADGDIILFKFNVTSSGKK